MDNLINFEVFHIETKDGKLFAHISFQNIDNIGDLNNGYESKIIPVNLREIQFSSFDNYLVNQSVKVESMAVGINL
jgi:hypothetical protein